MLLRPLGATGQLTGKKKRSLGSMYWVGLFCTLGLVNCYCRVFSLGGKRGV